MTHECIFFRNRSDRSWFNTCYNNTLSPLFLVRRFNATPYARSGDKKRRVSRNRLKKKTPTNLFANLPQKTIHGFAMKPYYIFPLVSVCVFFIGENVNKRYNKQNLIHGIGFRNEFWTNSRNMYNVITVRIRKW